ncbi:uncharacterized protein PV07_03159 [Cladophialophora immunda]|uniref:Zn(2)-C6 fungal-type domain-containing protein n=1 Tax=Cladophialophora immunda TaxID=569365 RepID=A0A0D2D759_9EURO|nr:uncharacterized protein PV07_03159 [Cladophialophora immunda]KIW31514.1 hypothetical protein PV07_03159 [Cladophialophora immunda]OQV06599.1 Fungal Zn2-Cys6 binuclear cluster domain-containing protein [Cladophialophora immunda]
MATKRPHNKSRNGCMQCKKRHVKCDEVGPPCANCSVRQIPCQYAKSAAHSERMIRKCNSSEVVAEVPPSSIDRPWPAARDLAVEASDQSRRLKELELMQQWCTRTCYSFTPKNADVFRESVVKEAVKHVYLMEAILAFTSVQMASETSDPVSMASYVRGALQHHSKAISALRHRLRHLPPSETGAIFACSILTMACTITFPLLPDGAQDPTAAATESVLQLFNYIKGIASIVEINHRGLQDGPFHTIFEAPWDPCPVTGADRDLLVQHLHRANDCFHCGPNSDQHQIYQRAIVEFEKIFTTNRYRVIKWLYDAGDSVLDGLRTRDPVATVIFIQWGTLLGQLEGLWWAQRLGQMLVTELSSHLSSERTVCDEPAPARKAEICCPPECFDLPCKAG